MLQKLFMIFVVLPLGIVLVVFAVANRHPVTVSLDPMGAPAPALSVTAPLYLLVLGLVVLGVLVGGVAAWANQAKWRRAVRQLNRDLRVLSSERDALKAELRAREVAALPPPSAAP